MTPSTKVYHIICITITAWKVSKYRVICGPYFPAFGLGLNKILRISPYSVRMRENANQELLRIWTHFTQCMMPYKFN